MVRHGNSSFYQNSYISLIFCIKPPDIDNALFFRRMGATTYKKRPELCSNANNRRIVLIKIEVINTAPDPESPVVL